MSISSRCRLCGHIIDHKDLACPNCGDLAVDTNQSGLWRGNGSRAFPFV